MQGQISTITFSKCFILLQAIQKIKCRYPWGHDLCSQVFRIQPCRAFMVSNRLSGVVFPPSCNSDTTAPALQTRIDDDARKEKETTIFNRAMNEIHDQH